MSQSARERLDFIETLPHVRFGLLASQPHSLTSKLYWILELGDWETCRYNVVGDIIQPSTDHYVDQ